jgi:hypothetical protein
MDMVCDAARAGVSYEGIDVRGLKRQAFERYLERARISPHS